MQIIKVFIHHCKIAVENLIYNFCSKNIYFILDTFFNMYSDKDDNFSIVSKLTKALKNKNLIKVFNSEDC